MTTEFAKKIWDDLNTFDCSSMVEKKGNLNYLSWANAWTTLMSVYPASTFASDGELRQPDGSIEVKVMVTVAEYDLFITRTMSLPVMDNRNNAILAPNARDISDTRMRCLVKCIALFGLGLSLYRGEDIPRDNPPAKASKPAAKTKMPTPEQYALIQEYDKVKNDKHPDGLFSKRHHAWLGLDKENVNQPDSHWNTMSYSQAAVLIKEAQETE